MAAASGSPRSTASSTSAACRSTSRSARAATSACRRSPSASRGRPARALTAVAQTVAARMSVRAADGRVATPAHDLLRSGPRRALSVVRGSRGHGCPFLRALRCGAGPRPTLRDVPAADCGCQSSGPAVTGDRRIVTALFADLVDYVRMLAEHDPEDVRARVTAALATMATAIERFDGTREKFIGDAVFAVFGWPRAHDDDAVRAALAALAIRVRAAGSRPPGPSRWTFASASPPARSWPVRRPAPRTATCG